MIQLVTRTWMVVWLLSHQVAGRYVWSKWKPATAQCPRLCSQPSGKSLHVRSCLSCTGTKCVRAAAGRCAGSSKASRPCYVATACSGTGFYTGRWSRWIAQSACPNHACPGETQTLTRKCMSSGRGVGAFRCPALGGVKGIARKPCPCARATSRRKQQMQQQLRSHMNGQWTEWGAWTCLKNCTGPDVNAYRKRRCENFMAGYYCLPDKSGVREVEEAPCRGQFGEKCFKKWAAWGDWSKCSSSCGGDTMIRQRRCDGLGAPCPGKNKDYQPCPVQRNCPLVDGRWGGWGRYELDCSVTCGDGVRKRYRECNNPAPSGGGRTCEGLKFEVRPCEVKIVCPIHGNWTEWSTWDCTVTCGQGGKATRHRECDNPAPAFGGNFCRGPDKDSKLGCNNATCPTANPVPELPAYLLKAIKDHLSKTHVNLLEPEGSSAKFICRSNVTKLFFKEFPDAAVKWVFNGQLLKLDLSRMSYQHGDVIVTKLISNDTGVYSCNIEYFPNVTKIVGIYALMVNSSSIDAAPRATKDLALLCHAAPFGLIFDDLRQRWARDGLEVKDFGPAAPQGLDPYVVQGVKQSDSGVWACSIAEAGDGRVWNTSRVVVAVGPPPTLWERLVDPRVLGALCGAVLALVLLFSGLFARQARVMEAKKQDYLAEWQALKQPSRSPSQQATNASRQSSSDSSEDSAPLLTDQDSASLLTEDSLVMSTVASVAFNPPKSGANLPGNREVHNAMSNSYNDQPVNGERTNYPCYEHDGHEYSQLGHNSVNHGGSSYWPEGVGSPEAAADHNHPPTDQPHQGASLLVARHSANMAPPPPPPPLLL